MRLDAPGPVAPAPGSAAAPVFNLADCFIVAGVAILMLELLREEKRRTR